MAEEDTRYDSREDAAGAAAAQSATPVAPSPWTPPPLSEQPFHPTAEMRAWMDRKPKTEEELAMAAKVSDCVFSLKGMGYTIVGVAIGTFMAVRQKNHWPMVTAGAIGTGLDMFDAFKYRCRPDIDAWENYKLERMRREFAGGGLREERETPTSP